MKEKRNEPTPAAGSAPRTEVGKHTPDDRVNSLTFQSHMDAACDWQWTWSTEIKVALSSLGWHRQHRLTPRAQALRCAQEKAVVGPALALLARQ